MPKDEVSWVLAHEVLHVVLNHQKRIKERKKDTWNKACDYAVHDLMMEYVENVINSQTKYEDKESIRKLMKMPECGLYDIKYHNMATEQIYEKLMEDPQEQNGSGNGSKGKKLIDSHDKWDGNGNPLTQTEQQQWNIFLQSTLEKVKSKKPGSFPLGLDRLLSSLVKPRVDWRTLLNQFVQYEVSDYSFQPPDRRYSGDIFLPDFNDVTETINNIVFWVDTSGSIGDKELNVFYSEIAGALSSFSKLEGSLGFFDHSAYDLHKFEDITSLLEIRPKGGGGTCFHAPFNYINEKCDTRDIVGIVVLTDGYASFPPESIASDIPVLWVITTDIVAPWGLSTHFEI